ncbi:MAG: hypothetical protein HOL15_00495 [Nitrospinaceae bacterium]|jgi:hypothetical protein|nr:hypothetical protein [Nitrospina sp.]MBT5027069.1 hypothetical protein [Nitrospina sp.]MBT5375273.1 hypothetical protein [Nitrospinaceae bacterium]MBT5867739.1 hypothetical protein [Nitrospinaceae bacterium]
MNDRLAEILEGIRKLEHQLILELQAGEEEFLYTVHRKRVKFEGEVKAQHRLLAKRIRHYLKDAKLLNILTAPVIWSCLLPAIFMDMVLSFYQAICFPIYGIPKVKRKDYIVIDRHYLSYLNSFEKMNCVYCGYFNGLVGYVQEIAARTEQYWCPIKHARKTRFVHGRYSKFLNYGDGVNYRKNIESTRRAFDDLK